MEGIQISLNNVSKVYDGRTVIQPFTLHFPKEALRPSWDITAAEKARCLKSWPD